MATWAEILARGWRTERCRSCEGSGLSRYEYRQEECRFCCGSGVVWISAKGRIFSYPGGPIIGRLSAQPATPADGRGEP